MFREANCARQAKCACQAMFVVVAKRMGIATITPCDLSPPPPPPHLFVLMLRYCDNLKAIRYESTSLNRIVADKSHRVIVTYV